jgi:hypothetical protein
LAGVASETGVTNDSGWLNPTYRFPLPGGFQLDQAINQLVELAMAQANGNISAAGRLLGVPHDFIRYRLGRKKKKTD